MILFIDVIKHNLTHQIFQQTVLLEQYSQSLASRTWQKMKAFTTGKSSEIFQEELQKIPTTFPAGVESSDHCKSCEKYWRKTERKLLYSLCLKLSFVHVLKYQLCQINVLSLYLFCFFLKKLILVIPPKNVLSSKYPAKLKKERSKMRCSPRLHLFN